MTVTLWQARFTPVSALSEDETVNTFHFDSVTDPPAMSSPGDVAGLLDTYYTSAYGDSLSAAFTGDIGYNAYDLTDAPPRVPFFERIPTATVTPGTNQLPRETALVVSYQAEAMSGVNQARRRNRHYLGPFAVNALNSADGNPNSSRRAAIVTAANNLLIAALANLNWTWIVWSPTALASAPVDNGWVDNAWDTQRRRGKAPTDRTTFDGSA